MPINLADWKSMTIIKNEVNIYGLIIYYIIKVQVNKSICIDCYYMIREGVQMEYVSSLLPTILAKTTTTTKQNKKFGIPVAVRKLLCPCGDERLAMDE